MNALIDNIQIIEKDGMPEYAIIPYDQFIKLAKVDDEPTIPHEVVGLMINGGHSIIKAWRLHLKKTQKQIAEKAGMTPGALSQIEKPNSKPHKATLEKIAKAMSLDLRQLEE